MSTICQLVLVSSIIGAGVGFAYGALLSLIMTAVPIFETAAANSLNTLMRSIGVSLSCAITSVVLARVTATVGTTAFPSHTGFRLVLAIGAGMALLALAIAPFLPPRRLSAPVQ
jgi:MFS family permease